MKIRKGLLTLLAAGLPLSAAAAGPDELRYDYLGVGVSFGEIDEVGGDVDFTGVAAAGSWGLHDNFALFAALGTGEIDTGFGDVDTTQLSVGINPHFPIANNVDIVIPVALEWADFDTAFGSYDDVGYSIGIGIRALLSPSWEMGIGVQHVDIFDGDDQNIAGNVRWHINDLFSVALGASYSDDASSVGFDVRFSF